ncbi:DNA polymerase-3 subunit epsilon [Alteribacillus iranensis]|uniref:DNA polymerase-3 subunit epsilon n=2 Tax=Alteribacillus iranensis TaxID=930128 RepID=A0A1I2BYJ3_9BACI|nr:3'-5' exonuclease [Alteribacillus iranensis]SFE60958.1 DNA polymerase-3 subunit epsilon [Alteribacillus iranensis]
MMFWKKRVLPYQLNIHPPLNTPLREISFTVFDTETTGFAVGRKDRLIEIGAVQVEELTLTDKTFRTYVNPERNIPREITELTGIHAEDVERAPTALEAIKDFFRFVEKQKSTVWAGHYVAFDLLVLKKELQRYKYAFDVPSQIDTLDMIGYLNPTWDMKDLSYYAREFGANMFERHSALGDARTTASLLIELIHILEHRGKRTLGDLLDILRKENGMKTMM